MASAQNTWKRIGKTQRRLWLVQAAVWLTAVLAAAGVLTVMLVRLRGSRTTSPPAPVDGLPHL